jgi:hypothetical protein
MNYIAVQGMEYQHVSAVADADLTSLTNGFPRTLLGHFECNFLVWILKRSFAEPNTASVVTTLAVDVQLPRPGTCLSVLQVSQNVLDNFHSLLTFSRRASSRSYGLLKYVLAAPDFNRDGQ